METVQELYTDCIKLPESNMRTSINRDELYELADDIKKNGLINPITVRPIAYHSDEGACEEYLQYGKCNHQTEMRYEVVAGQRRYLAHQIAGIIKIKCVVRVLSDDEALSIMTSENLARVDVNPVDEANHIGRLMSMYENDEKKVADVVNRGLQWVKDRVAVASMPDYMQALLSEGKLKLGVALALNEITDDDIRHMWTEMAARDGTSIAQARYWVDGWRLNRLSIEASNANPPEGYVAGTPHVVLFECAIDGKKYDARQFRQLFIHESNMDVFLSFVEAFKNELHLNESPAGV
jgi:ParB/RepB/Spo0J family partition protein